MAPLIDIKVGNPGHLTRLLKLIESAHKTIQIHIYILKNDRVGAQIAACLISMARQGVQVTLLLDAVGCMGLEVSFLTSLKSSGIDVRMFNPIFQGSGRFYSRRLHQKLILIDQSMLWIGGLNLAEEYFSGEFFDFAAFVHRGNFTRLSQYMHHCFHRTGIRGANRSILKNPAKIAPDPRFSLSINDWFRGYLQITRSYSRILAKANQSILMINSYFLPPKPLLRALIKARSRGVHVQLILPQHSDHILVKWASEYLYPHLLKKGVQIHLWQSSILHGKVAMVDSKWLAVGSYNLDFLSRFTNMESNLEIYQIQVIKRFQSSLEQLLEGQTAELKLNEFLKKRSYLKRLRSFLSYILLKYLLSLLKSQS